MVISLIHWTNNYIAALEEILGAKIYECHDKQEALKLLPETEIIITIGGGEYAVPIDDEMLAASPKLRWVFSVSTGVEKLPLPALHAKGVLVSNTKGVHAVPIAEYVLGGMLALSHHYHSFIREQHQCRWQPVSPGEDLEGKTLCVIGVGSIGREIGKRARAFDMRVIGLKKHPEPVADFDQVWGSARLHEALAQSDYVVLATPLTPETYQLMGKAEFQKMKATAVFINISRGDTVDEAAMIQALQEKQIAGAVLDVFHREPLPADHPLWQMANVIVTPHGAGISKNTLRKTVQLFRDNLTRYRQGQELINQLREDQIY